MKEIAMTWHSANSNAAVLVNMVNESFGRILWRYLDHLSVSFNLGGSIFIYLSLAYSEPFLPGC